MSPRVAIATALLLACGETGITVRNPPSPADPPERALDLWGTPPTDWQGCFPGFRGLYYNLAGHPDIERPLAEHPGLIPDDASDPLALPQDLDWWGGPLSFERYDASLDFGPSWWPVNESFADDPLYYAVRWIGWIRVTRRGDHELVLGAATDAWILLNGNIAAEVTDREAFETEPLTLNLNTGVYRVDVRYAHRLGSASGFRLRFARDGLITCYPEYGDPVSR